MYFDVNDTYVVSLRGYSAIAYNTYSVRNYNGEDLFVHALYDTVPEITKEIYCDGRKSVFPTRKRYRKLERRYRKSENFSMNGLTVSHCLCVMKSSPPTTSVSTVM